MTGTRNAAGGGGSDATTPSIPQTKKFPADIAETKETITEDAYKELLTDELEEKGQGGNFVWALFLLCITPNILNGFHVSSYTLLGPLPEDQWCNVEALQTSTNWTGEQQRNITQQQLDTKGCTIWNWDYDALSTMTFEQAFNYTMGSRERRDSESEPSQIACTHNNIGSYGFTAPQSTFVSDWELVCDRAIQRTSAQVFLSLGKFFGSFSFGIFADKFGRKSAFSLGAVFFIVSSLFCTFSPWYELFLVGRFGLGAASSGLFYPAFTMVVENVCLKYRSSMSVVFAASYPVGMILLAIAAYLIDSWRYLQFSLTVPAFLLIVNCYLLKESPRWLITKGAYSHAYRILFNRPSPYEIIPNPSGNGITEKSPEKEKEPIAQRKSLSQRLREGFFKQFVELYGTSKVRRMIFTSYFMFFVSSLSYYVTALNASNLSVSRYLYVAITGMVDLPSYLLPVIMLKYTGRRPTTVLLYMFTGIALLLVLAVPAGNTSTIVTFAMLGRFGISATYAIVTLYTAELYPTEIRNSALGTCSTFAHVGSISAPYVVDVLGILGWYIPTTICGCCVIVASLLTMTLPETGTVKLSDRLEDIPESSEDSLEMDEKIMRSNNPQKNSNS